MKGVGGMKRFLLCVLTMLLMFSLVSCGGTDNAETKIAEIGETVSTDKANFTLDRFEFADNVMHGTIHMVGKDRMGATKTADYMMPITDEELENLNQKVLEEWEQKGCPRTYDAPYYYESDEGKVYATMSFTIENKGTTRLRPGVRKTASGVVGSTIMQYIELQYGEYIFDTSYDYEFTDYTDGYLETIEIAPLDPPHEYRGYITVPEQVMNDTSEPLYLNVYLPNESGDFEEFTYQLR